MNPLRLPYRQPLVSAIFSIETEEAVWLLSSTHSLRQASCVWKVHQVTVCGWADQRFCDSERLWKAQVDLDRKAVYFYNSICVDFCFLFTDFYAVYIVLQMVFVTLPPTTSAGECMSTLAAIASTTCIGKWRIEFQPCNDARTPGVPRSSLPICNEAGSRD